MDGLLLEQYKSHTKTVDNHSPELVVDIETLEALDALKLLQDGPASLAAVDDMH